MPNLNSHTASQIISHYNSHISNSFTANTCPCLCWAWACALSSSTAYFALRLLKVGGNGHSQARLRLCRFPGCCSGPWQQPANSSSERAPWLWGQNVYLSNHKTQKDCETCPRRPVEQQPSSSDFRQPLNSWENGKSTGLPVSNSGSTDAW